MTAPISEIRRQLRVDDAIDGDLRGHMTSDHCRTGHADVNFLFSQLSRMFDSQESREFRIAFCRAIQKDLEALGPR